MMRFWSRGTATWALALAAGAPCGAADPVAILDAPATAVIRTPVLLSTVGSTSTAAVAILIDPSSPPGATLIPIATPGPGGSWTEIGGLASFPTQGKYRCVAVASGTTAGQYAVRVRDLDVTSTPQPPNPPNPPPPPPPPIPPAGLPRVIFIYETTAGLSTGQMAVLRSPKVRAWMDSHLGQDAAGRPAWRFWDPDQVLADSQTDWKGYWDRAKVASGRSLVAAAPASPKIVVFVADGTVRSLPLPETEDATITALGQALVPSSPAPQVPTP